MNNNITNKIYSIQFRPRFRDTDGVGHVNNAVYSTYLEVARSTWYESILTRVKPRDFSFILARMEIDFLSSIELQAHIDVQMWVQKIGNKSWNFEYQIIDEKTKVVYAKAKSVQVAYDYEENKSAVISDFMREKLLSLHSID